MSVSRSTVRYFKVLLLTLFTVAFLAESNTFTSAAEPKNANSPDTPLMAQYHTSDDGRHLLNTKTTDFNTPDTEARNKLTSWFTSAHVKDWIKTGKSDDYVKKALGLETVAVKDLKSRPMYTHFKTFWIKTEQRRMDEWLDVGRHGCFPSFVWDDLKLSSIPADQLTSNILFKTYQKYARKFDDRQYARFEKGEQPLVTIGLSTDAEMMARAEVLAEAKRSRMYVKKMLGMETLYKSEPAYKYYDHWLATVVELSKPKRV